ncbi:MAG: DEAD/DEAH box helicase [Desulfobacterales bacterium]
MDVKAFLGSITESSGYAGQISHVYTTPARSPRWADTPGGLSPEIVRFLDALGIERLYQHQVEAIEALLGGQDLLLTTGTASGKSLCYQIPILQALLADPQATALLVFPMKALARDQAATWNRGVGTFPPSADPDTLVAQPFDGDSGTGERRKARDVGRVLVTNPEMIHANLLPGHVRWQRFFGGLRYIVLDEVHTYTGFFGANMANVLRRLRRICAHHGADPQIVCCSATVGNPRDLAEALVDRPLQVVDDDASASGERTYVFWNPPRIKRRRWRGRRSANAEAHELMTTLVKQNIGTICFSKARTTAEMIYRYVRESLEKSHPELADRVIPYRGGYEPAERREMERRLRDGEILGVSATRALELGIDIGMLEACIIVGYPGLLNAFFQQAGRAGRAGSPSVCFLVGVDTPFNQFVMGHPEYIFDRPLERVVVDRDNPFVVLGHVRCASAELPIQASEVLRFGYASALALEVLEENRKVYHTGGVWYHSANESPAFEVRLRGYGDESTVVMDAETDTVIDRLDKFRALRLFYDGAIYLKYGNTYALVSNDTDRNLVRVKKVDVSYYTDPLTGTAVDHVDAILDQRPLGTGQACLGEVYAILDTPIYERVRFYTLDRISQHPTHQPSIAYEAMSFWLIPPDALVSDILRRGMDVRSGLLGILYCVSKILPLFLTSDANDFDWSVGSRNSSPNAMFWYEFYLHGIGNAEQCYERFELILEVALDHLLTCDCEDGCPNCTSRPITPYHTRNIELGEAGKPESRRAAVVILNGILTGQSLDESLALFATPREKRGQSFLPHVVNVPKLAEPHRMPLSARTRNLMQRKLERERITKPTLDHVIEPKVPVGFPAPERGETLPESDAEHRSGIKAIRRGSGNLSKQLHRRLNKIGKVDGRPLPASATKAAPEAPQVPPAVDRSARKDHLAPDSHPQQPPIRSGDSLARKVLRKKRKR